MGRHLCAEGYAKRGGRTPLQRYCRGHEGSEREGEAPIAGPAHVPASCRVRRHGEERDGATRRDC